MPELRVQEPDRVHAGQCQERYQDPASYRGWLGAVDRSPVDSMLQISESGLDGVPGTVEFQHLRS